MSDDAAVHFDAAPEHDAYRAQARAFLEAHASLRTGTDADWSRGIGLEGDEAAEEFLRRCREWQHTLFDNGWAGITWPKEFGGRGETIAEALIFEEEASRYDVSSGFVSVGLSLVGPPLMIYGTPAQQERYLAPLLRGDEIWCQLFSEPGAGSDLASLATRAVRDGDEFVVTGQKVWTSEAQHSDYGILIARTDPDAPKHRGITFFLLDMRSPGVDIRPLRQATGHTHFNEVFFDEVRVPAENVVGAVNEGWKVTRTVMSSEAGMIGGNLAVDPANFDALVRLARDRGRINDPLIRQGLADLWASEQMARLMGLRFQSFLLNGTGTPPDPSVLKNFITATNARKANLGLAVQSAAGMVSGAEALDEGLWQNNVLAQYSSRIGGGTNEVHRNMIAERALGLPREAAPDLGQPWRNTLH